ncbi:MAG: polysaccharide biosynthesis tyrosine autokinase [Nevskia sp.]|nr:polysaccharide biosynthesis tyrosine autokinase [Nevskia sp.]
MNTLQGQLQPLPARAQLAEPAAGDQDLIDLPDLIRTLNRYKWGVLAIGLLAAVAAALYTFAVSPVYRATLTLLIEAKDNRAIQTSAEIYNPGAGTYEYYASQYEILRARSIAEKVVDKLKLIDSPDFENDQKPGRFSPLALLASLLPSGETGTPEQIARSKKAHAVDALLGRLTIDPVLGTQLVKINYDSHSADLAANIANEVASQYIDSALEARLNITRQAVSWLSEKMGDVRGQMEQSEKSLQDYRDKQNLVNVGGERNLLQEQLVDNSKLLRDAQIKVTDLGNSAAKVSAAGDDPTRLESISTLLLDPVVQKASASYLDAQESYRQQEQRYGPKHPAMDVARGRLDAAKSSYHQALRLAAQGVKAQYEIARQNYSALAQQVASNQGQLRTLDDKSYQMNVLERNVDSNRQLFDTFLKQLKEADTGESFSGANARVIDPAVPPLHPFSPRKGKITLLAGVAGLLLGIVLATLRHLLNEEVRSAEDLEALTRIPTFGVLPLIPNLPRDSSPVRFILEQPRSPYAEGLRSVQTALQVSDWGQQQRRLMVTSSLPDEGKSTLAACLAAGLGGAGKLLLVETDLRKPSLARYLGLKPGLPGLIQLLNGQATLQDSVQQLPNLPFQVLLAGKTVSNPADVLSSDAFHELVQQLSQDYDYIIFDCPPCQVGADALILSRQVDGVLFVVKPDKTNRRTVKHVVKRLQLVQANLIGSIVNQVDLKRHNHYTEAYYYEYE